MKTLSLITIILLTVFIFAFKIDANSNKPAVQSSLNIDTALTKAATKTVAIANAVPPPVNGNQVPFLRYWNPKLLRHYFTTNPDELGSGKNDWIFEKTVGWLLKRVSPDPIYAFYNPSTSAHYYSLNPNSAPSGFTEGGNIIGAAPYPPYALGPPVTEYKTPDGKDYMYVTTTNGEVLTGWVNDGVVFYLLDVN